MAVAVAGEDYPAEGCDGGANERTYHHDPEIGPCFGASEDGTEGAGGIDGAVVDGDPYDVDQAEGEADGQSGKFAESLTCVGGAEHYEDEEEGEQALYQQGHAGAGAGLNHIGGQRSRTCGASEVESRSHIDQPVKESGADGGAYELCCYISAKFTKLHAAREEHGEGNGGIDVAAGDVADTVDQAKEHEAEAEADAEDTDFGSGQHSAAACKEHQKHSSDALSDVFSHKQNE